jgi:hypothetical protein
MDELKVAVAQSYIVWCEGEYLKGWDAQMVGEELSDKASQAFKDGWADCYEALQMTEKRYGNE